MTAEDRQNRTQEKEREAFLAALREGASVSAAAKKAGVGRSTVYEWRNADEDFAKSWDDAYETGTDALEDEAKRRATVGVQRVKFYKGAPIYVPNPADPDGDPVPYVEHEYSDTLLMQQLNARRPEKYRTNHKVEHTGGVKITIAPDDADL